MALVLLLPLVIIAIVGVILHDAIRRPTIRRLAMRNITRRRGEAALVILGSLLGTAIITASFIVGDTLGASVRDNARTELGPADEIVRAVGLNRVGAIAGDLTAHPVANTDGVLSMTAAGAAVASVGPNRLAEPFAQVNEVDFDAARAFGGDVGATGFEKAGATPTGNEAVLGKRLATKLKVHAGDHITAYAYGVNKDLVVREVVGVKGIAGFGTPSLFVAPGTIASLVPVAKPGGAAPSAAPPESLVLVSNTGGVFSGATRTPEVTRALQARVAGQIGMEVVKAKQDLLDRAKEISTQFSTLFGSIGAFSVIAGILLLVNIFVMLADERKGELGMLRAIGLKRNQLVRAFGMEGGIYSVLSAACGAIAGIAVGRAVVVVAAGLFRGRDDRFRLDLRFALKPSSLLVGFLIGASISLLTVWGTSFRLGRLNVIRAIRDIAEAPATGRRRVRSMILGALGMVLGVMLLMGGIANNGWFGALVGVPLAAFSSITLLRRFIPRRVAVLIGSGTALVWGIAVFSLLPKATQNTDIPAFVIQGVLLVGAAVAIVATNDDIAIRLINRMGVSKRTLSARLGFAYPLARVFRTSMLLGMYAIVVFTLTFMSVFSQLFSAQAPRFANETRAGYDILVDSNFANPVPAATLQSEPGVEAVATFDRSFPKIITSFKPEGDRWPVMGIGASLLARGVPTLKEHEGRFADDRATFEAVIADPNLAVIDQSLLERGGPPKALLHPGDTFSINDTLSGQTKVITVAGVTKSDFVFNGVLVGHDFARSFLGVDATPSRFYVAVKPGADPQEVSDRIAGDLVANGVKADPIKSLITDQLKQQRGFFRLMQGYLALGLIIGIAGLGVVMVRAVRERRRQIGMLRAMGFQSGVVRTAFLVEAGFIALQGIVLGTVLALVTSYNLLTNSSTFGGQDIAFAVPWVPILLVFVVALGASMLASALPAGQAAGIRPAVALRIAD